MSCLQYTLWLIFVIMMINSICSSDIIDIELTTESIFEKELIGRIRKIEKEIEEGKKQLKIDRNKFEIEKQITKLVENIDIISLNVGGEIIITTRKTLTKIPKSIFTLMFNGRWEHKLQIDTIGNIFFDFNPIVFRHLLDQLQIIEINNSIHLYPPSQSTLVEPFKKMLRKLGLNQFLSLEKKNIITFNIGGQIITNQRTIFTSISNSTFDTIVSPNSKLIHFNNQSDVFLDYDPKLFQYLINQLRERSLKNIFYSQLPTDKERIAFKTMLIDLSIFDTTINTTTRKNFSTISIDTKWKQNGLTIAGGSEKGNQSNQLHYPWGIHVDDDNQCVYIADSDNHRIMEWKYGAKFGHVVAGGNGEGKRMDQLNMPHTVIIDKKTNSFIICDTKNRRIVRWSRRNATNRESIISDIDCWSVTMDNNGDLYVGDVENNEVRRWKIGEKKWTIVAGGNGKGDKPNQLNFPADLFVDKYYSVYVSDLYNHRVMKWMKGAKEGILIAGGHGLGNNLTQLNHPFGMTIDHLDNIYVADSYNHRVIRWSKHSKEGHIIIGKNGRGSESNELNGPIDISFDQQGNLYIVDFGNHRVQKFEIDFN